MAENGAETSPKIDIFGPAVKNRDISPVEHQTTKKAGTEDPRTTPSNRLRTSNQPGGNMFSIQRQQHFNTDRPSGWTAAIIRGCGWILLLATLLALSGCGFRWWYAKADYLLQRKIDQYIDLSNEQKHFVKPRLQKHLDWHRIEMIPRHIAFLEQTRDGVLDGVTIDEIHWFSSEYRRQVRRLIGQLAHDSVQLFKTLTPTQIDLFEKRLVEDNTEYEAQRAMTAEQRRERRAEKTVKELKDWLGSLNPEQEKAIVEMSRNLPDNFDEWYQQRLNRQRFFIETLRQKSADSDIEAAFFTLMNVDNPDPPEPIPPPMVSMILAIDRLATPKQRQNVADKLQSWIDDLQHVLEKR
jgi:hypothetical protein